MTVHKAQGLTLDAEVIASEFYESNTGVQVNLEDVLFFMCAEFQTQLSFLPTRFSVREFLESVINDAHDDPYSVSIKSDRISTVNKQLQELCIKNGFDFINNSNVDNTCLNGSQLHLNAKGSAFLATNFIKFLRGSNENVKSSYRSRRNEDFRRTRPARFHLLEDLLRLMSIS
jgi:hypothetical protein